MSAASFPAFNTISVESLESQLKERIHTNLQQIEHILAQVKTPTWQSVLAPIEELDDVLSQFWAPVSHLNSVRNEENLRQAYNDCLPLLSDYGTALGQNAKLYQATLTITQNPEYVDLDPAQQKILRDHLRDFKLSGIALPPKEQERYKSLVQQLSQLSAKFEENVLDASNAWIKLIDNEQTLAGLPERVKTIAAETAQSKNQSGWMLTLDFPCYHAVMTYADNRALRQEMYTAYSTRASDQGPHDKQWDNTPVMDEILHLRHEKAQLLDFHDYSEYSLATKMANKPEDVISFLNELVLKTHRQAEKEWQEVKTFAKDTLGMSDLQSWDVAYVSEKLCQQQYQISQEELRPYFPIDNVLRGFFALLNRLFGITLVAVDNVECWHPDVRVFAIQDARNTLRGHVYIDLYAREKKRGGAWADECRLHRKRLNGERQLPIAFVTCNFSPASGGKPATLDHEEVLTLFHEFGHALHILLTKVDYADASGINGVPWDAVEFPSQFMEHWCWNKEVLDSLSGHVDTGEKLPDALYQKMIAAKNFQAGLAMLRQCEFALFDFRLHREFQPGRKGQVQAILESVRKQAAVIPVPPFNRFAHGFSHIFAGGYAAGYYSYKWAEVLACDAYSRFEEEGVFNPQIGKDFLTHILEKGGSEDPKKLFVAFRGREPHLEPLLKYSGIEIADLGDVR